MKSGPQDYQPEIEITDLYPSLTAAQQQEADENLERYLELALRIYERLRTDPDSYQQFKLLTQRKSVSSMHDEDVEASQPIITPSET